MRIFAKNQEMRNLFILMLVVVLFSCGDDNPTVQEQLDSYFMENNINPQMTEEPDVVYYVIGNEGSGLNPNVSHDIVITYTGRYTDGSVFDSGTNVTFPLNGLIEGWQIGIPLIKKGGDIKLIIPPNLAYGSNPQNGIRANAVLVFDIELHDFF